MRARGPVWLAASVVLAFTAMSAGCLLTQDLDALKSGECDDGEKACEREDQLSCVPDDDPAYGCAEPFCDCALSHATARCGTGAVAGQCVVATCESGWLFCGGDSTAGCKIDGRIDVNHCGQCNRKCTAFPNASEAACSNGSCALGACNSGFGACDDDLENGCETNLKESAEHCGKCDRPCESGTCVDGQCT
jgi:hypothetical protein